MRVEGFSCVGAFNPFGLSGREDTSALRAEFSLAAKREIEASGLCFEELIEAGSIKLLWSHAEIGAALNWGMKGTSKRQQARANYAIAYCNGDRVWQAKLAFPFKSPSDKKKPAKYMAPKGVGSVLFQPRLSERQYLAIEERYEVKVPRSACFWEWLADNPKIPVELTEGGKKALCLLDSGRIGLSLFGVSSGWVKARDSSGAKIEDKREFVPGLSALIGDRLFRFWFDQDEKYQTRQKVRAALSAFGIELAMAGANVQVCAWSIKRGKGIDDVFTSSGEPEVLAIERTATPFAIWKAKGLGELTSEPSLELDQRWLPDARSFGDRKWLAIKSPKGTGKTFGIRGLVEDYRAAGKPVIVLTHRVQLGAALCRDFGLPFASKEGQNLRGEKQFGLCVDSLHEASGVGFDWELFEGQEFLLVIDEVEQVMNHALTANTAVKGYRAKVQQTLARMIFMASITEGARLVTMDTDHCSLSIDHLQHIAGLTPAEFAPYMVVNDFDMGGHQRIFDYSQLKPEVWLSGLKSAIATGRKVLVMTSGQRETSTYGTQSLEQVVRDWLEESEQGSSAGAVLRVDSESIATKDHPAFGCVNQFVERTKGYQVVIASPSLETGISIENDEFDLVFGIFQGVQTEASVRQALARVRRPIDRHIWVAQHGMMASDQYTLPKQIKNNWDTHRGYIDQILAKPKYSISFSRGDRDDRIAVVSAVESQARYAALSNAGRRHYWQSVIHGLRMEGHAVIDVCLAQAEAAKSCGADFSGFDAAKDELLAAKGQVVDRVSFEVSTAGSIEKSKSVQIDKKTAVFKAERDSNTKFKLGENFGYAPEELTPELVRKLSDREWAKRLKLLFFSTIGAEFVELHDFRGVAFSSAYGTSQPWMPDIAAMSIGPKVRLLHELGIPRLLMEAGSDREFCEYDRDVQQLLEIANGKKSEMRRLLGITVKDSTKAMGLLSSLFRRVGLALDKGRAEGPRGSATRYRAVDLTAFGEIERHVVNHWWMQWAATRIEHEADVLRHHSEKYAEAKTERQKRTALERSQEAYTHYPQPEARDRVSQFFPVPCAQQSYSIKI